MKVILASGSPRRRELLAQIGIPFEVRVSEADETVTETQPERVVLELSRRKAEAVYAEIKGSAADVEPCDAKAEPCDTKAEPCDTKAEPCDAKAQPCDTKAKPCIIIGADTIVACDGRILGKPRDAANAERMLRMLSGRSHQVYTGVTVLKQTADGNAESRAFAERTEVHFAQMTDAEIRSYVATGDPLDKAGSYGIQGMCARYITGVSGDFYNVMGLPVARLYQTLKEMGYAGI